MKSSSISTTSNELGHVVMLLNNPCINDSRVIKSAEALVKGGWKVTVVCRQQGLLPILEEVRGVTYQRLGPVPNNGRGIYLRFKAILFPQSWSKPKPFESLVSIEKNLSPEKNNISKLKSICPVFLKELSIASRRQALNWKKKLRFLFPVFRKFKRMLTFPVRVLYWFHETDEFKSIALKPVLLLKPDVVHCHDLATLPAGVAISKACNCKMVYDSHELEMHRNAKYPKVVENKRRKIEKKGIVKSDAVITVSESIADHLKHDYKIARPYVVMNAPDFDNNLITKNLREDIGISPGTPLAVYVGSVTINRGIDFVIRSLQHNQHLHFATVGPRRPATQVEIHELANKLGVSDRVHFVDPVPSNDVVSYISSADVSVLPIQNVCLSYYYCMPNKLLESVFAGIPVAVANLVEMRRFVETYQCGVVMDETDPESIAKAISSIISSRQDYILPEEKRLELSQKYSWATQATHLREIYLQLKYKPQRLLRSKVAA